MRSALVTLLHLPTALKKSFTAKIAKKGR
jgi:hypothetical protein